MREDAYYENQADKRTKEYKDWKALKEAQILASESSLNGLGDVVEKITEVTGIKSVTKAIFGEDCGCDGRKESLNAALPFGIVAVNCVNQDDFTYLKSFFSKTRTRVDVYNQNRLTDIFNYVFDRVLISLISFHIPFISSIRLLSLSVSFVKCCWHLSIALLIINFSISIFFVFVGFESRILHSLPNTCSISE